MRAKLIFNPAANLGRALTTLSQLRPVASQYPGSVLAHTRARGHASELAAVSAQEGFERVIALGGDGTVHEVVNGLMKIPRERRPELGIVPLGSGNDFAGSAGITGSQTDLLKAALEGIAQPVDISHYADNTGRDEYWVNSLGIGFDALINIYSRQMKLFKGFWIYFMAALKAILLNNTPFEIHAQKDGMDWTQQLLMLVLSNGTREGGGFLIAPSAKVDDNRLNYAAIDRIGRINMLIALSHFMKGTQERLPFIHLGTFESLEITADRPLFVHSDGEIFAGLDSQVRQIKVACLPNQVKLVRSLPGEKPNA